MSKRTPTLSPGDLRHRLTTPASEKQSPVKVLDDLLEKLQTTAEFESIYEEEPGPGVDHPLHIIKAEALGKSATGKGRSRKEAKQEAAYNLVKKLNFLYSNKVGKSLNITKPQGIVSCDHIVQLENYCVSKQLPVPQYETVKDSSMVKVKCSVSSAQYGESSSKKVAKQIAAANMLKHLKGQIESEMLNGHVNFHHSSFTLVKLVNNEISITKNSSVLLLLTIAKELNVSVDIQEHKGYNKLTVFMYKILTDPELTGVGFDKFNAAKDLLDALVVMGAHL